MKPFCSNCLKAKNGPATCEYQEDIVAKLGKRKSTMDSDDQNFKKLKELDNEPNYTPSTNSAFSSASCTRVNAGGAPPILLPQNSQELIIEESCQFPRIEEDVEAHLEALSLLAPSGPCSLSYKRQRPISMHLKNALLARAVMLSNHPKLFPGNPAPSILQRYQVSKKLFPFENVDFLDILDVFEVCDYIQAVSLRLGLAFLMQESREVINFFKKRFYDLFRRYHIFDPCTFNLLPEISSDVMTENVLFAVPNAPKAPTFLTDAERAERLQCIGLVLKAEVLSVSGSGGYNTFQFAALETPRISYLPRFEQFFHPCDLNPPPEFTSTIFTNTQFENELVSFYSSRYYPACIDVVETCIHSIETLKLYRRIIVLTQHQKYNFVGINFETEIRLLHNQILACILHSPQCCFKSLACMEGGVQTKPTTIKETFACIAMLIRLHFCNFSNNIHLFSMGVGECDSLTSLGVLHLATKGLVNLILAIQPSVQNDCHCSPILLLEADETGFDLFHICLLLFHAFTSATTVPKGQQIFVFDAISKVFLPLLERMGQYWPVYQVFSQLLRSKVSRHLGIPSRIL